MAEQELCVFCKRKLEHETSKLYEKGSATVNEISRSRGDSITTVPGQLVHKECRRTYCRPSKVQSADDQNSDGVSLRSTERRFYFQNDCLYCGTTVTEKQEFYSVRTKEYKDVLLSLCDARLDDWAEKVRSRILSVHDLPAADAIYHQACSVNFRTGKCVPVIFSDETLTKKQKYTGRPKKKSSSSGRPADDEQYLAFLDVVNFFKENDDEQTTITDLVNKMAELLEESSKVAYSEKHMMGKLKQHFGDDIIITTINKKQNVVTLRRTAQNILLKFHEEHSNDPEIEKQRVIETAAKLILSDIKAVDTSDEFYPNTTEFEFEETALNFLPGSLKMMLHGLITQKHAGVKIASIGQSIMQAARPRVLLAPLQIGLAVQMHHHFSSRFLIDSLNQHGFCSAYNEVLRFEKNAAVNQGTDIPNHNSEFIQYAADNVDHNIRTLDGANTFHGMGIIAIVSPGTTCTNAVPRRQISANEISSTGAVKIQYCKIDNNALVVRFDDIPLLVCEDPTANLDLLWQTSLLLSPTRAAWSGFMQTVHITHHPGKSSIMFLPMIDMSSSDPSCIYSTLCYVAHHAEEHKQTAILTFDQPLWWKALSIIQSEPDGSPLRMIVLRLGTFHTEMSFLGAIGHLMAGSGLSEILELIYAPQAVQHIMSGKAVSRAVRAHLLMDAALRSILIKKALGIVSADPELPQPQSSADQSDSCHITNHPVLEEIRKLYDSLLEAAVSPEEICDDEALTHLVSVLERQRQELTKGRTAKLWFQYLDMIDLLKQIIKAERLGDWSLHLQAIQAMLPYFAASGHNLYAKSARLYLQSMLALEKDHPDVYQRFKDGFHVGRRSDRSWAGLSTDLIIEQVLMRSLKTSGGLTRGRGMTEQQRIIWLLSTPACAEVNRAMQELTSTRYNTSEQHKDVMKSRQQRDLKDTQTIIQVLEDRSPFRNDPLLRNIMTGMHAGEEVNVDDAKSVGEKVMSEMTGQTASSYSFKKRQQAVTMMSKSNIKIGEEQLQIDPQLLFQRLVIASGSLDDKEEIFTYELSSCPRSLFDKHQMMREAQKSLLADALWSKSSLSSASDEVSDDVQYILDGGALLHRLPWPRGGPAYRELCLLYCDYVTRRYKQVCVVFDGYQDISTKCMTHMRRSKGKHCAEVSFTDEMKCFQSKDDFLSNPVNKQRFISLLGTYLERCGCVVLHSKGDADLLIVTTAVRFANLKDTIVVGDDTDLVVLLCYHVSLRAHNLFLQTQAKTVATKGKLWNMKVLKERLGKQVCDNILFIHAVTGCDTTSRLFGIGKGTALKKATSNKRFQENSQVFHCASSTADDVATAGEQALVLLYGGKFEDRLDKLRYQRFCQKTAAKTTQLQPEILPPTTAAAKFHSYRVFLQVQQWKGNSTPKPTDWGWQMSEGHLLPILTDKPVAPENLLKVFHCGCHGDCSSMRCTCRKNGLECSPACTQCRGTSCSNSRHYETDIYEVDNF